MPTNDAVLRILLVDDRIEDAEHLTSLLRNGGMAVRPHRADSIESLQNLLRTQSLDLVIATLSANTLPFTDVVGEVEASGKDIPVLAALDAIDEASFLDALKRGARDVVLRHQPHLPVRLGCLDAERDQRRSRTPRLLVSRHIDGVSRLRIGLESDLI